jgi:hypothetical protein
MSLGHSGGAAIAAAEEGELPLPNHLPRVSETQALTLATNNGNNFPKMAATNVFIRMDSVMNGGPWYIPASQIISAGITLDNARHALEVRTFCRASRSSCIYSTLSRFDWFY